MANLGEKITAELKLLVEEGRNLEKALRAKEIGAFFHGYQQWYTRGLAVVRTLIPHREADFRRLYERDNKRKVRNVETFTIEDYTQALPPIGNVDSDHVATIKFFNQLKILESAELSLTDILTNIRGVLQADLFDSELDAARELLKNGHLRAAGAVAGVVLEGHLAEVCRNHSVSIRKKDPHISDFNEALKAAEVFDVVQWRGIQRLADIRNLCDHKKQREPTPDEVEELINGVDKSIKTLM